jgi:hypothetical protein
MGSFFKEIAAPVQKTEINGCEDSLRWPRDTLYPLKLGLTSPTSGGRSVGIVRLRTKTTEFIFPYTKVDHKAKLIERPCICCFRFRSRVFVFVRKINFVWTFSLSDNTPSRAHGLRYKDLWESWHRPLKYATTMSLLSILRFCHWSFYNTCSWRKIYPYALRHKGVWGNGCIDPCFLDLGTDGDEWLPGNEPPVHIG